MQAHQPAVHVLPACSLFDNHMSRDLESNLEYMFKHFGFYFPDSEYLKDPEGLMQYLVGVT